MLKYINHLELGRSSEVGWLESHFHFSFANYYNANNLNFGLLRVLNDDIIAPHSGFASHPHRNMEIVSYVVEGKLTHSDSMGHEETLERGQVQYMSAGHGVRHSEYNHFDQPLRLLQIWALPDTAELEPSYGSHRFSFNQRANKWLALTSHVDNKADNASSLAPIKLHADINIYVSEVEAGSSINFKVEANRQAYLVLIEGKAKIENISLVSRDALEILEQEITIVCQEACHVMVLEMAKA